MKTIRWKFMSVFIIATTASMVIVLLLFNLAMRIYFERNTRAELHNIFSTMNILVERQLMGAVIGNNNKETLLDLSAALTASRLTSNTEFFVFDGDFTLKFPSEASDTDVSAADASAVADSGTTLTSGLMRRIERYDFSQSGVIERVREGRNICFIAGMTLDRPESGRLYIVFVTGMSVKTEMIGMMNLFLIAIMLIALTIGIFYTTRSAKSLTKPIRNVGKYAREIGNGNFIAIPPDSSSLETHALIESINEMSARLKASDQSQKSFLQNASHELRTPLMSIQGYSEAIEKGIGYDPKEAAAIIKSESIRLTTLVEELITLSKIDNNIYDKEFQKTDLAETVSDCVYRLNGLAMKENKKITPALIPGVTVLADDTLLSKALGNVVSNCLRYAKTDVKISLERIENLAVITVSDDGEGFDSADLPHIFERFYKGKGGKFGLGLAIAQKALEVMGGTIEAKNSDKGAEFIIKLSAAG
jgi:signal transduction histidine kinase